jgi:hypothetical protein
VGFWEAKLFALAMCVPITQVRRTGDAGRRPGLPIQCVQSAELGEGPVHSSPMSDEFSPRCNSSRKIAEIGASAAQLNAMIWSTHSPRIDPISRSTKPFCQGEPGAMGLSRIPIARNRRVTAAANFLSPSRIR